MDLITVRLPSSAVPPLHPADLMPDPEQLKAYYKNLQVRGGVGGCVRWLLRGGSAFSTVWASGGGPCVCLGTLTGCVGVGWLLRGGC